MANLDKSLATKINQLHREIQGALRTSVQKAIEAGELLATEKEKQGHGNWIPWIESNLTFNRNTAAGYIRCYQNRQMLNAQSVVHLKQAYLLMAKPSKEELEEKTRRETELEQLAEEAARKRIIAEEEEVKAREQLAEVREIELEIIEEEEFETAAEYDESEEEFEKRVTRMVATLRNNELEERRKKAIPEQEIAKQSKKVWEAICNHDPLDAADRERIARAVIKMLFQKYPRLQDEPLEVES